MEVFDLGLWEPLIALASSQSLVGIPLEHSHGTTLNRLARKLHEYLDATADEFKTLDEWGVGVSVALEHLQRFRLASPQIDPRRTIDNRMAWASALATIENRLPWAA